MAGRKPSVTQPAIKPHRSNKELGDREENTPVYKSQNFIPPLTLTDKELVVWNWLVSIFRETLNCRASDADIHLMEFYCRAKVAADEADAELKLDPRANLLVDAEYDKDGNVVKRLLKPNPNIKKRSENSAVCIKLFDQLGLSPIARAKAGLGAANAKNDADIFRKIMDRSDD